MTTIAVLDERREGESITAFTMRRIRNDVIDECIAAAENFETGRKWSDDPDMQNQAYYTEGEVSSEIADAIRRLKQ